MFFRTIFTVEVLSRGQLGDGIPLERVAYEITDGDCSGNITMTEEQVDGPQMVQLLVSQGSEPEFLGLNEDGQEID